MTDIELAQRLERLERDNRRPGWFAIVASILVVALVGAGFYVARRNAIQPSSDVVRARKFEVLDKDGKVSGIISAVAPLSGGWLGVISELPSAHAARSGFRPGPSSGLYFSDGSGKVRATMIFPSGDGDAASLNIGGKSNGGLSFLSLDYTSEGGPEIGLDRSGPQLPKEGGVAFHVGSDGEPVVVLYDGQGFTMKLGSAETRDTATGQTQSSSAASILMFNKKGNLIWRAP
jgi:hypothetical protein